MEVWRPIPGYEGYYEASSFGTVRSLDRVTKKRHYSGIYHMIKIKGRNLKPNPAKDGYLHIALSVNGEVTRAQLHRVIALTFIDGGSGILVVNHKDGDKTNNAISNLEWCTPQQNQQHAIKTGLWKPCKSGEESPNFRGKVKVVNKDGVVIDILVGTADIRKKGYNTTGISNVLLGKIKTHKGCFFIREISA